MSSFGTIYAARLVLTDQTSVDGGGSSTACGRTVPHEEVEFSYSFKRSRCRRKFQELVIGGGESTWNSSRLELHTANPGDGIAQQSYNYTAGVHGGYRVAYMGVLCDAGGMDASATLRFGLFDSVEDKTDASEGQRGVFFQYSAGVLSVVRRGAAGDDVVPMSAFNGLTILFPFSPTKPEVFTVEVDSSGCGIGKLGFLKDGTVTNLHTFAADLSADISELPVRYELKQSGTGASTAHVFDGSVVAFGPQRHIESTFVGGGSHRHTVMRSRTPVTSLRLEGGCRRRVILRAANTSAEGNVLWEVVVGGALTGAEWTDGNDGDETCTLLDTSAHSISGGDTVAKGFVVDDSKDISICLQLGSTAAGQGVPITLCCTALKENAIGYGSLQWIE